MDPYTLGYITHWAPGDLTAVGPLHATHEPPFYVAGSDHGQCGYMEGAVATGRAAARAVLGGDPIPLYPAGSRRQPGRPSASCGNFDTGYTSTGAERCCTSTPPSTRSVTPVT